MIKLSESANKTINFSNENGIPFPLDRNNRRGFLLNKHNYCSRERRIDFCIFPEWSENHIGIRKLTPRECISKLMTSSLSIYPLTKQKEIKLLENNSKFCRNTTVLSYLRTKDLSNLQSLPGDLNKL